MNPWTDAHFIYRVSEQDGALRAQLCARRFLAKSEVNGLGNDIRRRQSSSSESTCSITSIDTTVNAAQTRDAQDKITASLFTNPWFYRSSFFSCCFTLNEKFICRHVSLQFGRRNSPKHKVHHVIQGGPIGCLLEFY